MPVLAWRNVVHIRFQPWGHLENGGLKLPPESDYIPLWISGSWELVSGYWAGGEFLLPTVCRQTMSGFSIDLPKVSILVVARSDDSDPALTSEDMENQAQTQTHGSTTLFRILGRVRKTRPLFKAGAISCRNSKCEIVSRDPDTAKRGFLESIAVGDDPSLWAFVLKE